jgi:hypothetical protein
MNFRLLFLALIFFISQLDTRAQLAPKYSNEFLNVGVGARALGMSLAQVASVQDVTAGYWNPAGLLGIKSDLQIAAMHSEYFAGLAKYDYAAVGKMIDSVSAASISFIRFGVDDIPNTTELIDPSGAINYDRITKFSAADYAFLLSYGRKGFPLRKSSSLNNLSLYNPADGRIQGFRWGVTAKIIYRQVGNFARAWGFGLDAGAQYDRGRWHFGASLRDVTSTFNAWSYNLSDQMKQTFSLTQNDIPSNGLEVTLPRLIVGAARDFQYRKMSFLAEANAMITTDGKRNVLVSAKPFSIDPYLGGEAVYNKLFSLRAGVGNIQRIKEFDESKSLTMQLSVGVGLRIRQLHIDFSMSSAGNTNSIPRSQIFSLRYDIYKNKS